MQRHQQIHTVHACASRTSERGDCSSLFCLSNRQYNTPNQALPLATMQLLFPADFKVETFLKALADQ